MKLIISFFYEFDLKINKEIKITETDKLKRKIINIFFFCKPIIDYSMAARATTIKSDLLHKTTISKAQDIISFSSVQLPLVENNY